MSIRFQHWWSPGNEAMSGILYHTEVLLKMKISQEVMDKNLEAPQNQPSPLPRSSVDP